MKAPTTVQQNVPAWTLFGMFFIVVPLGAALIRERQDGMLARLLTMPISYLTIISGKIVAYVIICMVQFVLIMGVGKALLPLLGPLPWMWGPRMVPLSHCPQRCPCSFRVWHPTGYHCKDIRTGFTFGAVSVVIAAALGGVMVPVYVMPKINAKYRSLFPSFVGP